ncbi:hypothetical protein QR665_19105 [Acinetobacter gerneri]|uniref:hypothetical protein n=2 Tax=Acinetobacter gerneri TaxID=202952 RepID=UPI002936BA0A|nr:hypothetical protein [Acinetobacter gerneri]MDV2441551.1 hypothetical protein [Acinetobacter gerneri]
MSALQKINEDMIVNLPKGDLHVHLNGAIPTNLVKELLAKNTNGIPSNFDINKDLNILEPQKNLQDYLKPWKVLNLIPRSQSDLNKIVLQTFFSLKLSNIKFVEIRNTIFYIANLNSISIEEAIIWMLDALQNAFKITKINYGLIITVRRSDQACEDVATIISAIKNLGCPKNIVGLDLAGNEDIPLPENLSYFFKEAKHDLNLGITIHAGETGNLSNILHAINLFEADRIGHGTAAMHCIDTMNLLREKDIAVEVCPISNRRTNSLKEDDGYTFHQFLKYEVPFVLCSDNPAIHNLNLIEDYKIFLRETNNEKFLINHYEQQKKYSFIKGDAL